MGVAVSSFQATEEEGGGGGGGEEEEKETHVSVFAWRTCRMTINDRQLKIHQYSRWRNKKEMMIISKKGRRERKQLENNQCDHRLFQSLNSSNNRLIKIMEDGWKMVSRKPPPMIISIPLTLFLFLSFSFSLSLSLLQQEERSKEEEEEEEIIPAAVELFNLTLGHYRAS